MIMDYFKPAFGVAFLSCKEMKMDQKGFRRELMAPEKQ